MIKIGVCACVYLCVRGGNKSSRSFGGNLKGTTEICEHHVSNKEWERARARLRS